MQSDNNTSQTGVAARAPAAADERLLEFLYLAPIGLIRFRPDGRVDLANAEAARLLLPHCNSGDMTDFYALLARLAPQLRRLVTSFRAPFGPVCDQMRLQAPGAAATLALTIRKIDPETFMAVVQDITRAVALEATTLRARQKLDVIFEHIEHHAVYRVGVDGRIAAWNNSLRRIGGWEAADVAGAPLGIVLPPDQMAPAQIGALLDRAARLGTATVDCWHVCKNGRRFWGSTLVTPVPDAEGQANGFVLVTRDLSEQVHMTYMHQLIARDELTGALNRRAGLARLEAAFDLWRRLNRAFAILIVDIDHFKSVNDSWGHPCGDTVLVATVAVMRDRLRERDCIIRWGGEEFLLLLADTSMAGALLIADRVRMAVAANVVLAREARVCVSVSVGVAQAEAHHRDVAGIIECADRALYAAKNAGRNRVMPAA